jgi:hypothetical protein
MPSVPERCPVAQRVGGEQEGESEADQDELGQHVEDGYDEGERVERGASQDPDRSDDDDRPYRDHDVPRPAVERVEPEGRGEVVGEKQRRERDHDQVVEEQHPAGHEAREVVGGASDEGRGTAGLRERRGRLGVGERDEQEQPARAEQYKRGEADGVERDDAECEVDRGGHLAVGDRGERTGAELAAKPRKLARH